MRLKRNAKTVARRAGSLKETVESRRLSSYPGSSFTWIRAIGGTSVQTGLYSQEQS